MGPAVLAFGAVVLVILVLVARRNRGDRGIGDGGPRRGMFGDSDGDGGGADGGGGD
ncbi:MAG: hypothetical protein KDK24_08525 [Pseudooceanicola sp.]|nr:hypothetical protein [Pseudooceanicola sp.]